MEQAEDGRWYIKIGDVKDSVVLLDHVYMCKDDCMHDALKRDLLSSKKERRMKERWKTVN